MKLVLSCEHATNFIPKKYSSLFKNNSDVLQTHEAYDPGTLDLFKYFQDLANFSLHQQVSRLLIETNRSINHPKLFSRFSTSLGEQDKAELVKKYYQPYRDEIENIIIQLINEGYEVFHLSVHSFTPILNSVERNTDIGLLYDPARTAEKSLAKEYKSYLNRNGIYKVRMNYPYLGKADGLRRNTRNGSVMSDFMVSRIPPTAKPRRRKGRRKSHTRG